MRIVKEAEERKNEILDIAEQQFVAKGFDSTSTNDILREIGIARGTLYYHFKSKEEILDAVTERITEQLVEKAKEIFNKKELSVFERIIMIINSLNISSGNLGHEILEQVHRPQNALMHQKMQKCVLSGITPLITSLIEELITQGTCQTDYPQEVAEMALIYYNAMFDDLTELNEESKQKKLTALIYNLERLLNMEQGSIQKLIS
ncbi:TetR/AcrR family transcriptional regulator [Anaerofustis stercorihominis]|uniref:TetR/AcrR family transcriptional regulator n=1 Tax=Anaerofustis stercorihominis TaxID=214853 RepID=A0A3E3E049_9FIRM|nr:TetR/AcrR family transcriptional regulator [Anaerofustis stercorihominis]RGD74931.1 TetR/AcrR family transcriptional regulator [Anaerofustis stercorihominis]